MNEVERLFEQLRPLIDAEITGRIVMFHNALVERGQIGAPPALFGATVDYKVDEEQPSSLPQLQAARNEDQE